MSDVFMLDVILRAKQQGMGVLKEAENGFAGMAKAAATAAVVMGVALAAGAVEAYRKTEELGQAAYDMGEKFGLAGGQASAWISVAQQLGLSSDVVSTGFKFLAKNAETMRLELEATGKVSKIAAQAYSDVGVNVLDASGHLKDSNELMLEVADRFKGMKDGAEKTGLAVKLFGRSGSDLIPILNEGRDGIQAMTEQGLKLGTVMSTSQVNAIHAAYLAHKQFDAALEGLTNRIGIAVMPIMARFFDYMVSTGIPAVERLANWLGPILTAAWNQVAAAAMYFWPTLQQIGNYIRDHVWPAIVQLAAALGQLLAPVIAYIKAHFDDFKVVLIAAAVTVGLLIAAVVLADVLIGAAILAIIASAVYLYEQFKAVFPQVLSAVQNFVVGAVTAWWSFENTIIGGVRRVIGALDQIPGVKIPLPALQGLGGPAGIGGRAGGHVIPAAGGFEGTVYKPTLFLAGEGGSPEEVSIGARGRGGITVNLNVSGGLYADGPQLDRLANAVAQRLSYVTGR